MDISWAAAYALEAAWLIQYYGDTAGPKAHWASIKAWVDGQLRQAANDTVPDFFTWGDWCAVGARSVVTPATGPEAAAANFLLALKASVEIATSLGDTEDATRYQGIYQTLLPEYQSSFWNETLGTWAKDPLELQTLTSLSLAIPGLGDSYKTKALSALLKDIEARDHHLTVGSAGQKWLLRTLSSEGHHDTALQLALQTSEPSWGYWLSQGATTCWESWTGVAGPSHPPTPTRNHIFLCGGVGEWMYEHLGGVTSLGNGYEKVSIQPSISKSLGPTSVNMTVTTVRGPISSHWTRMASTDAHPSTGAGSPFLEVSVALPIGVSLATVHIPLLGADASTVQLQLNGKHMLWSVGKAAEAPPRGIVSCHAATGPDGDATLALELRPGSYHLLAMVPSTQA